MLNLDYFDVHVKHEYYFAAFMNNSTKWSYLSQQCNLSPGMIMKSFYLFGQSVVFDYLCYESFNAATVSDWITLICYYRWKSNYFYLL